MKDFREVPEVAEWQAGAEMRPGSRETYLTYLHTYWKYLRQKYPSVGDWLSELRKKAKSSQPNVRIYWAQEVKHFFEVYRSRTGKPLTSSSERERS